MRALIGVLCMLVWSCSGAGVSPDAPDVPNAPDAPDDPTLIDVDESGLETAASLQRRLHEVTPDEAEDYAQRIVPVLLRRSLRETELERLAVGGMALPELLAEWSEEDGVQDAARDMISTLLAASGIRDGTDLNLPGNLAAQLVRDDAPWTDLITADYCVDGAGERSECDTGAPYVAGILTTRAFMAGNESRYNLRRARTLVRRFVCVDYPIDSELQPRIDRELLIPMFQATSAADQTEDAAPAGFGNGLACYACHGQFSAHAQLFVRYDEEGHYREDATGLQLPDGELGVSEVEGLFTSHFQDPARASSEQTQVLGQEVFSLVEAAEVVAESPRYVPCAIRHFLAYGFDLAESEVTAIDDASVAEITRDAGESPSLPALMRAAFAHPDVIRAALGTP
ncbi:MAG: hypothetical protein ACI9KE_004296 [Polyangiales bacterium]|jgi:hypothetical protein